MKEDIRFQKTRSAMPQFDSWMSIINSSSNITWDSVNPSITFQFKQFCQTKVHRQEKMLGIYLSGQIINMPLIFMITFLSVGGLFRLCTIGLRHDSYMSLGPVSQLRFLTSIQHTGRSQAHHRVLHFSKPTMFEKCWGVILHLHLGVLAPYSQ